MLCIRQHTDLDELRRHAVDGEEADELVKRLDAMREALKRSLGE
jgi:hypothetical protein|tara:strand:- start:551 stop:682 length:132 start_codon:yes stop_codon:yes gene_type:complete